ncbi:MAG: hypothetical protein K8H86_05380 [Ignavibacteriaceae bacterium]|nr:hypothetical protein [Ignavibacteriaceae bacterium]
MEKVVKKIKLHEQKSDFDYWQTVPMIKRLEALEQIRKEYIRWHYGTEPGFQRVFNLVRKIKS